jgi:hypothetical protein
VLLYKQIQHNDIVQREVEGSGWEWAAISHYGFEEILDQAEGCKGGEQIRQVSS